MTVSTKTEARTESGEAAAADTELSLWGKLGLGSACVVCCSVPMLFVLGLLTAGAAVAVGTSILLAVGLGVAVALVIRRRG